MISTILLYFLIFIFLGLLLNFIGKYDLITISVVYVVASLFMYFVDIYAVIYLVLFFGISESVTSLFNKKHGQRTYKNLLGNCLASIIFLVAGGITEYFSPGSFIYFGVGALAGISAAFSDTLSSEIGRLSVKKPIMINSFKEVEKGIDGAITLLGTAAATLGALITAMFFWFVNSSIGISTLYTTKIIIVVSICGLLGSLIDSYIGAFFETKGYINNAQTNFLSTFITGLIALVIMTI